MSTDSNTLPDYSFLNPIQRELDILIAFHECITLQLDTLFRLVTDKAGTINVSQNEFTAQNGLAENTYEANGQVMLSGCDASTFKINVTIENNIGDSGGDGILDINDNCPNVPNADQANNDGDAEGDVCDDDNDGVLDINDCTLQGATCNDNDSCTINDIIDTNCNCNCIGTFQDSDGDGTCDADDICDGSEPGISCDDGDVCTINDIIRSDCSCLGTFQDSDNDGVCDIEDQCDGPEPGSSCDDGDPQTINDVITEDCDCVGEIMNLPRRKI